MTVLVGAPWAVLFGVAQLGATNMGITALGLIHARGLASRDPLRSLALMTASFGLGQVVRPAFTGYTHGIAGSFVLPSLIASTALVVAVCWAFGRGGLDRTWSVAYLPGCLLSLASTLTRVEIKHGQSPQRTDLYNGVSKRC